MTELEDRLNQQPRRRVEMIAKISGDDWRAIAGELWRISTEIDRAGGFSASSVSGGYSTGHIIVTSEDGTITHDSWAAELNRYLDDLKAREDAAREGNAAAPVCDCQHPETTVDGFAAVSVDCPLHGDRR